MASLKPLPPVAPPPAEYRSSWCKSYRAALHALITKHDGKRMPPAGTAHLAGEHADFAVMEEMRRFGDPKNGEQA